MKRTQAASVVINPEGAGPFVFTCEHASHRVHDIHPIHHLQDLVLTDDDQRLLEAHWGYDIGAADVTRALSQALSSPAILSGFSRLLIDPNRHLQEDSLIVRQTSDGPVSFNQGLTDAERTRRIETLWDVFHQAVDKTVSQRLARGLVHLLSIHSFTPVWQGETRAMEIGVLYDEHEEHARVLEAAITDDGFKVALNEPYTGKSGLIYSVARHGRRYGLPFLELEIRNDLIDTPNKASTLAARLAPALAVFAPP